MKYSFMDKGDEKFSNITEFISAMDKNKINDADDEGRTVCSLFCREL